MRTASELARGVQPEAVAQEIGAPHGMSSLSGVEWGCAVLLPCLYHFTQRGLPRQPQEARCVVEVLQGNPSSCQAVQDRSW